MSVVLREVRDEDLPVFYEDQRDPDGVAMAGVPTRDREAFMAHWTKIRADPTMVQHTVDVDGEVAARTRKASCFAWTPGAAWPQ